MRILKLIILTLILQLVALPLASRAVPIANLYNTGLDAIGNYLPAGGLDGNYTVVLSPSGPFTPVAISDTGFPFPPGLGPWVINNPPFSRWIGPDITGNGPGGNYLYRTTFNLPANATNVMISGVWGTDDPGLDILINGSSTGQVSGGFTVLVPFSVTSGFNVGLNTLDFLVDQVGGGPTGLRVDGIRGKYDIVPEPVSWALAAIGMGGMFMCRRV